MPHQIPFCSQPRPVSDLQKAITCRWRHITSSIAWQPDGPSWDGARRVTTALHAFDVLNIRTLRVYIRTTCKRRGVMLILQLFVFLGDRFTQVWVCGQRRKRRDWADECGKQFTLSVMCWWYYSKSLNPIVKSLGSKSIRHRPDAKVWDGCLIRGFLLHVSL